MKRLIKTFDFLSLVGKTLAASTVRLKRNTMKSSTKDYMEGKFHKLNGRFKEIAGELSDNPKLAAAGTYEMIAGKVQERIGQVKRGLGR